MRRLQPDIRTVHTAIDLVAHVFQACLNERRVLHITSDHLFDLPLAVFCIAGLAGALYDIRSAVVFGSVTACPEAVQVMSVPVFEVLRDYRRAKAKACERRVLGEGLDLDGTGPRAFTLEDRMRDIVLADIGFISGIKDDHRLVCIRIIHPGLELLPVQRRTGRVVRGADVDDIRCSVRKCRAEAVFLRAGHVDDIAPARCLIIIFTCTACHDVGIHINRINRIADRDHIILLENFLNIAGIALGAVGNKDLIIRDFTASCSVIILRNRVTQKFVAEVGRVAAKGLRPAHFIDSLVQCLNNRGRQRLRHIADSHTDQRSIRMLRHICVRLLRNRGKQIASR